MESSRRDLFDDMAEHRSIFKNNQNTYYPLFCFTPKTSAAFPKTGISFLLLTQAVHGAGFLFKMRGDS